MLVFRFFDFKSDLSLDKFWQIPEFSFLQFAYSLCLFLLRLLNPVLCILDLLLFRGVISYSLSFMKQRYNDIMIYANLF